MKTSFRALLLVLCIVLLTGCSQKEPYIYRENGGNAYITLSANYISELGIAGSQEQPVVEFSSVAEMKNKIKSGSFTNDELKNIARFHKNEDGQIMTCNIGSLYEPTFFDEFTVDHIKWYGRNYSYNFSYNGAGCSVILVCDGYISTYLEGFYSYRFHSDYTSKVPTADGKGWKYGLDNGTSDTVYTLTQGDTEYTIHYHYDGPKLSHVSLYAVNNAQPFVVEFRSENDNGSLPFEPTLEQMLQIGVKKYVETEVA